MQAFYKDEYYLSAIRDDELKFIDVENIVFSIGRTIEVIKDGRDVYSAKTGY